MSRGHGGIGMRRGVVAALLLIAPLSVCLAGPGVSTPGGGALVVEAVGLDGKAAASDARALAWSLTTDFETRTGIVPSTAGPEPDDSPALASDPRTGAPVLIWSRWDGQAMKLAWSRFDSGAWSEPRDVTFGPGDDRAAVVGVSAAGAFVFFWRDDARVLYAPIDLGTGRLFAAPRALQPITGKGRDLTPNGGTDVPILRTCGPHGNTHCSSQGRPPVSPGRSGGHESPGIEGGTDVPILHSVSSSPTTTLSVISDSGCQTMVLAFARKADHAQRVVAFRGAGSTWTMGRLAPAGTSSAEAFAAAAPGLLESVCR